MSLKFDRRMLRESRQTSWLVLDLAMVALVVLNLLFIIFDTLFSADAFQAGLAGIAPGFTHFYAERVHAHFILYDLAFVSVFLAEFCFQWVMAVRKRTYPRWYFYPFLHWYDLVGCIPIGSLRLLRLLRIVSLLVRLQKMGIIDLTQTGAYRFLAFYFNAFIDEVSDRVILRTLDDVRREVAGDSPIARQLVSEVIAPQRQALAAHLSRRIGMIADHSYRRHQEAIRVYVQSVVSEVVAADPGVLRLERMPVLGKPVVATLRQSINDIVYEIFDRVVRDLSVTEDNRVVEEAVAILVDSVLEDHPELGDIGTRIALEAIDLVKERVRVQHWKEALDRREREAAQLA